MSDQQMDELYERLVAGKSKQATSERVFLRGFNAGIDFAIRQQRMICEEVDTREIAE